jgi:hypothetical membrane protein
MNTTLSIDNRTAGETAQRAAAWAGIIGPLLFTATFLALELVQGSEADRVAETVSTLEAGPHGWVQQVNFVVFGALTFAFAVGLHRAVAPARRGLAGPLLLALSGVAGVPAAMFPIREDAAGTPYSSVGHVIAGTMFFATTALGLALLSRRLRADVGWSDLSRYTGIVGVVAVLSFVFMGTLVMPDHAPLHEYAGLAQRALILLVVFPCRIVLSVRMLVMTGSARTQ